jgi:hypothetical protein
MWIHRSERQFGNFLVVFKGGFHLDDGIRISYFLQIIKIAIIPGIHPAKVSTKTIRMDPQPLSKTASGGQIIQMIERNKPILFFHENTKFHLHQ